jgi:TonB family protein
MKYLSKISTLCLILSAIILVANAQTKKKPVGKKTTSTPTKSTSIPTKSTSIKVIKPNQTIIGGVINGKATLLPKPIYPEESRKLRISGTVGVRVLIDESGNVISAKAESGVDNLPLRAASEAAAMQSKFSPTTLGGKPVKVSGIINYNFVEDTKKQSEIKFVGLGVFFSVLSDSVLDQAKFDEVFDFKDFKTEFTDEFGVFSEPIINDMEMLVKLREMPPLKRVESIKNTEAELEKKLNEAELWQFRIGKYFGEVFTIFSAAAPGDNFEPAKLNEPAIKASLAKIKDLLFSVPPEFPKKTLTLLEDLSAFSDKLDIKKPETYREFFVKAGNLFEAISPGSTK